MAFRTNISLVLALFLTLASCSKKAVVQSTLSKPEPARFDNLRDSVTQIAALAKGHVGVSAMILETGETVAALNPRDHFPMQSVYKLPISMAVMQQLDAGKIKLEQKVAVTKSDFVRAGQHSPIRDRNPDGAEITVNELIRFAIAESDGTASDVLMKLAGGAQAVQKYLTDLSVNDLIVLNTEKEIGQDWQVQYRNFSTPDAAVALLRALHEKRGLSESSQAIILKYLVESTPGAKRLKGLLPAGTTVAHKTGTSGAQKGVTAATNDIGIITLPNGKHLAIAVFVSDSPTDEATREDVIAKIAKAVWDAVAGQAI
jgi:beta-lactamase class A